MATTEIYDDPIYFKNEKATQAELTAAAAHYVPKDIPGGKEEFSPQMDKMAQYVWGCLIHDGWTCNKEQVCMAISTLWDVKLTVTS